MQSIEKRRSRGRWKLTDAKARFSEVVKLARERPQRVTVDGEDAVVIVAAAAYDKEQSKVTGAELVKAFGHAAVAALDLGREPIVGTHRDVGL